MTDHIFDIRAGDEIVYGKLRGVRFWSYQFADPSNRNPPCTICSFQHDHEWVRSRPTQSAGDLPSMENDYGLNVYKTVEDALRGSADAVNGVVKNLEGWTSSTGGLVLGEVEFWGRFVEHKFGYRAQFVQPTRFLHAWGTKPRQIVDDLNMLWFADGRALSSDYEVLLAVQRGGAVCAADIGIDLRRVGVKLAVWEAEGFVSWKKTYDFNGAWKRQLRMAQEQGECLHCNRSAHIECAARPPRLWQITPAGQIALLAALRQRGGKHG